MENNYVKRKKLKFPIRILLLLIVLVIFGVGLKFIIEGVNRNKNNKTIYSYNINQNVNYKVNLYKNNIYETNYLDMNQIYLSNVVKGIDTTFNYEYQNTKNIPIIYEYGIVAKVVGEYILPEEKDKSKLWNKEFVLLPTVSKETNENLIKINENINIDYGKFDEVINDLKKQISLPITAYLSVDFTVKVKGYIDYRVTEDIQVINLKMPLQQQAFKIKNTFEPEVIKDVKELTKKELDDLFKREVIGFILLAISFSIMFVFYKDIFNIRRNNYYNQALNRILKEYGDIIIEINDEIKKDDLQVIEVKTFNEMLDLEDELKVPILFYEIIRDKMGEFVINHNSLLYRYTLKNK